MATFKVPRTVVFGELPKTSTGKIQKFEPRKQIGSPTAIDALRSASLAGERGSQARVDCATPNSNCHALRGLDVTR